MSKAQGVGCTDEAVQKIVANTKKVVFEYDAIGLEFIFLLETKYV